MSDDHRSKEKSRLAAALQRMFTGSVSDALFFGGKDAILPLDTGDQDA